MKLFFRKIGEGPVIVVLHGLFGMSDNWLSVAKSLENQYCFYLPDQRNHGRSPHDEKINYEIMAEDLKEFFDRNVLSKAFLIGHSMGGKVALSFAKLYPQLVKKMIVVDISPLEVISSHLLKYLEIMQNIDLNKLISRKQAEEMFSQKSNANDATILFLLKNLYRDENNNFKWRLNLTALQNNIPAIMSAIELTDVISTPSLFIKGGKSNYIGPGEENYIYQKFLNATILEIPQANHWVHASAPEQFIQAVRDYFSAAS